MESRAQTGDKSDVQFLILDSQGRETVLTGKPEDIGQLLDPGLTKLIQATVGSEKSHHYPNHMEAMQELSWVDFEPASDKGHFRFYPNGALIYQLLVSWCDRLATDLFGALPVRTPFIYLSDSDAVRGQIGVFSKSVYPVSGGQDEPQFVLRFNDDLGLFGVMQDSQLTFRHLPLRTYEHTPSFRYGQSGSLSGIRRGRYFSFTDIHSFSRSLRQGLEEYWELHRLSIEVAKQAGILPILYFRVTRSFYPQVKEQLTNLLSGPDKMLVEVIDNQRQYWIMKHIICTEHPQRLFHIQLDLVNGKRFRINYADSNGTRNDCVIVHASLGSIEKWMIITLENALKMDTPVLPLWLSPTQIRIIPVSDEKHLDFCLEMAGQLKAQNIRVDVDERKESVGWRIRAAAREWVPYIVVIGDKEKDGGSLSVRVRGEQDSKTMSLSELSASIRSQTANMPFRALPGLLLSRRPIFRGRN